MATLSRSTVASVLFTVFGGPGILLFWLPWGITRFRVPAAQPHWQTWLAATLIAVGIAPLLESIVRFVVKGRGALVPNVPTEHLVVSGFYRFVRNPMYLSVFSILAGETLLFRNVGLAVELAIGSAAMQLFVIFYEEPKLTRMFGGEYRLYCTHVPRWIPRLTPWRRE